MSKVTPINGKKQKKALTRAQQEAMFTNRINTLEQNIGIILNMFQKQANLSNSLGEKLEEANLTIKAFHSLFLAKSIFKEEELKAEVVRVTEELETEREIQRDKEIDEGLARAGWLDKGDDTVIESGDLAIISFEGTLYGETEPFPGGTGKKQPLIIGSNAFIPGFEDQLIGSRVGDNGVINTTFAC